MLGVIAGIIIVVWFYFVVRFTIDGWRGTYDSALGQFFQSLIFGALVSTVAIIVAGSIMTGIAHVVWVEEVERTFALETLADGTSTTGSFFLGSGYVDEEPSFMFYRESGENQYVLDSVYTYNATVVQDGSNPRMTDLCDDYAPIPTWFEWPLVSDEDDVSCDFDEITFYVPDGSIQNTYNLDAQ